jgi:hypothetical protein
MLQSLVDRRIGLAVAAEPYSIPDASLGAGDLLGSVAILWTGARGEPLLLDARARTGLCDREIG